MKAIVIAVALAICTAFSGCSIIEPFAQEAQFKIIGVSPTKGITVSVYGRTCNFSFTTDKSQIYEEVKRCAGMGLVMSSAPPAPIGIGEDGVLIYPEPVAEEPEPIDVDIDELAKQIAEQAEAKQ